MSTRVRRLGVLSVAKIQGLIYFLIGLFLGGAAAFGEAGPEAAILGTLFSAGALIFMPIFYGVMGFVLGAFTAWVYNLAAGWIGGLELELDPLG